MKVDLGFGLKMVKACDPGARLKMVKVPRLPDPYIPPVPRKKFSSPAAPKIFLVFRIGFFFFAKKLRLADVVGQ